MPGRSSASRLLTAYYLATPAFALADFGFGLPVRVAEVLQPGPRLGYYGVAFVLGLLCAARPAAAPWAGMGESATNLLILLLSILLPIWSAADALAAGGAVEVGLTGTSAMNALLSGGALIVSFHRNQAAALGRRMGRTPPPS